ncbi:Putative peptidoglycan binding domain-containing protein [Lachnospiraceae bacterium A10]|jgi:lipoprotein-anchoring transpeptidase ErfK/SrfK|nr:Putative peptidoglycan binding domain-containing protein [Lachnospiraceae bacterium A10]
MLEKMKVWNWKKIGIISGIAALVLAVIYVGFSIFFQSHFFFRSTVNGVSASAASVDTVVERLDEATEGYELTIVEEDGEETIDPESIDLVTTADADTVEALVKKQNGFAWVKYLFTDKDYESERIVSFDEEKLAAEIQNLELVKREATTETQNASFEYSDSAKKFVIVDEVYGDNVDVDQLTKKASEAIMSLEPSLDVAKDKLYVQPTVTADSEELKDTVDSLNDKIGMSITYTVGDATEKVDTETIASWIVADEKGDVSYDESAMREFVKTMESTYNTVGKSKSLATSYGTTVTVAAGNYGWKIDEDGEIAQLKEDLEAGKDVSRDFVYAQKAASRSGNDYGNSYVEVNITAQHVYLYVDGSCVFDTDCVTGNVAHNTITHCGAYAIAYCEKDATLRGANYTSEVSYWMPFHNGEGLHDASWRSRFGGTIYKTSGSHGCVNLPTSAAKTIFSYVSAGFPVLVYELPGTENTKPETDLAQPVIDAINAIGEVTTASGDAITAARAAYEALPADAKPYVTNLGTLEAAEAAFPGVVNQAAIDQAAAEAAAAEASIQSEGATE